MVAAAPTPSCYVWQDYGFGVPFRPGQCSFFEGATAIPQAVGWIIVVAFGALFTILTSVMVFLDYRFGGASHTSEQFSTAGEMRARLHTGGAHHKLDCDGVTTLVTLTATAIHCCWPALSNFQSHWHHGIGCCSFCAPGPVMCPDPRACCRGTICCCAAAVPTNPACSSSSSCCCCPANSQFPSHHPLPRRPQHQGWSDCLRHRVQVDLGRHAAAGVCTAATAAAPSWAAS